MSGVVTAGVVVLAGHSVSLTDACLIARHTSTGCGWYALFVTSAGAAWCGCGAWSGHSSQAARLVSWGLPGLVSRADHFLVSLDGRLAAGGGSSVEVRLLGPVQVLRAGREVGLGGPRQRGVFALLVLEAGRVVPAGRLAEELWLGRPPPGASKTLRSYVSRLRAALEPDAALTARAGGYVLSVGR